MTPHLTLAGMRLLAMSIAMFALTALPQPPPRSVLHFGHLWDGTRLMDDVVVVVDARRGSGMGGHHEGEQPRRFGFIGDQLYEQPAETNGLLREIGS